MKGGRSLSSAFGRWKLDWGVINDEAGQEITQPSDVLGAAVEKEVTISSRLKTGKVVKRFFIDRPQDIYTPMPNPQAKIRRAPLNN